MSNITLDKLKAVFKSPIYLAGLSLFIAAIIAISIYPKKQLEKFSWNGLTPGVSTIDDVNRQLGNPTETIVDGDNTLLKYKSKNNEFRKDTAVINNNNLVVVKEEVIGKEKGNLKDYTKRYGQANFSGYGDYYEAGFTTYVFSNVGLAVIASPVDGTILQLWHFKPMMIEEFKSTIGKNIKDTPESTPESF